MWKANGEFSHVSSQYAQYLLIGASSRRSLTLLCMRECVVCACVWIWGHVCNVNARGQNTKCRCPRGHHTRFYRAGARTHALNRQYLAGVADPQSTDETRFAGLNCYRREHQHCIAYYRRETQSYPQVIKIPFTSTTELLHLHSCIHFIFQNEILF